MPSPVNATTGEGAAPGAPRWPGWSTHDEFLAVPGDAARASRPHRRNPQALEPGDGEPRFGLFPDVLPRGLPATEPTTPRP
ncbi:hypothetical protein [Streptomyces sp. NPDC088910]|uniref:hypothetical protein n=1 Tax=unclassified Streptomyces TaxID=2593676 RepID=UPI00382630C1